uniref:EamA domain-containing protein n=2 Tax=Lepeophtheirus salmonis TaxID=72036 RepID=A0A0K2T8K4_LEPSM
MDRLSLKRHEEESSRSHQETSFSKKQKFADEESVYESSLDKIRKNLMYHFMQRFFIEESELSINGKQQSNGLNIGNLLNMGRNSTDGYTRLGTEEDVQGSNGGGQVVLDSNAPLKWMTKRQFVQKPTRYNALESLGRDSEDEEIFEKSFKGAKLKEIKLNSFSSSSGPSSPDDENDPMKKKKKSKKSSEDPSGKFIGIFLAAISGLFFTLCSVTVKLLARIDPSEVLVFRAVIQLVLTLPLVLCSGNSILGPKGVRVLVYLQGVIGCLTVTCIFIGFARLPVGDAATIIFCSPIFVMIFSHILLREHCGLFRVVVISMLFMGVVLIAKPPFLHKLIFSDQDNSMGQDQGHEYDMVGYGAALGGTILTASNFVCMRKLRDVHFSVLIFAFSVMSCVMSSCIVPLVGSFVLPETIEEWVYAVLVGVFGLLGQSLLALALKYETAGVVSVTRSMDIAVAYVIQIVWFGDIPLWTSILGAFVVILAVFTMAMETAFLHILETTFGSYGWC